MRLIKIIPILYSVLFIINLCEAKSNSIMTTQSSNVIKGSSTKAYKDVYKNQNTYIGGSVCTYAALASSIVGLMAENEVPLFIAGTFTIASPILVHSSHSKARNIAKQLVLEFPQNDSLQIIFCNSKKYYGFGFIPMGGAIAFSTAAIPTSLLVDDSAGPFFYTLAAICLITRNVLWSKAMKGYLSIAQHASQNTAMTKLSFSSKYDPSKKTGGLSLNFHF